jgi:hypothetical protein
MIQLAVRNRKCHTITVLVRSPENCKIDPPDSFGMTPGCGRKAFPENVIRELDAKASS